jgi:hypothetical protein
MRGAAKNLVPRHLRVKARRHHNNRGTYLIKGEIAFRRLERFCRKYGLRLEGSS